MRVDSYTLANYSFTYVKSFMGYHVTTEYNGYDVWEALRCCTWNEILWPEKVVNWCDWDMNYWSRVSCGFATIDIWDDGQLHLCQNCIIVPCSGLNWFCELTIWIELWFDEYDDDGEVFVATCRHSSRSISLLGSILLRILISETWYCREVSYWSILDVNYHLLQQVWIYFMFLLPWEVLRT